MQSFKLSIPPIGIQNDLTIIYKEGSNQFHELKVPKDDLLKSLRYFQRQSNEINRTKLIYIQDNIDYNIFENFIFSINTKEIFLDETNYESYYELSCRYEYQELRERIETFIATRPDVFPIIDKLSQESGTQNNSAHKKIDYLKEEIIAKHLEISLQNGSLKKLPIEKLVRILNSPNRQIKDHHLLFTFVFEYIKEMKNKELSDIEKENLFILPSCLDFSELENDEIEDLFDLEESTQMIFLNGTKQKMKKFIENEKTMIERIDQIENQIKNIQINSNKEIEKIKNEINKQFNLIKSNEDEISIKQKENDMKIENLINNFESNSNQNEILNNSLKNSNTKIEKIELKINEYDEKINQNEKRINEIQTKIIVKESEEFANLNKSIELLKNEQLNQKNEIDKNHHKLSDLQVMLTNFRCQNGVFQYLFDLHNKNPVDQGLVKIIANSNNEYNEKILKKVIDPFWKTDWWVSKIEENSSIKVEFQNFLVKIDAYRLRVGTNYGSSIFKSWILKGITDDNREIELSEVNNTSSITEQQTEITMRIQNEFFVKSIILIMKGKNASDRFQLVLRNIEIFGFLKRLNNEQS